MARIHKKKLLFFFVSLVFLIWLLYLVTQLQLDGFSAVTVQGGHDRDPDIRAKRDRVRKMMIHAWKGYVAYSWGANELNPVSKTAHNESIFGTEPLGVTIVDSIDTLFIMGLMDEYKQARDWIEHHFNPGGSTASLSVFEVTIRLLGGLLSIHALTGDELFYLKALEVGKRILPAFDTSSGIPSARINLGQKKSPGWSGSVLAEWGTLSLEFDHLAEVSGSDDEFRTPIRKIYQSLDMMETLNGLFAVGAQPLAVRNNRTASANRREQFTLGGMGDSFYEYLLKNWIQSGGKDEKSKRIYLRAMEGVIQELVRKSEPSGLTYLGQMNFGQVERKMDHLACFAGGMFALGGRMLDIPEHLELGASLTATCHESYDRSATKLGPEAFRFNDELEAKASRSDSHYILRPEVIESYFILWRLTHDPKYRKWGWEAVEALERHCRVDGGGYSGLRNVYDDSGSPAHDDVMQSFFLAETLKYLYLLFSDDRLISLDQWVFNTEAHPLPIQGGANPLLPGLLHPTLPTPINQVMKF